MAGGGCAGLRIERSGAVATGVAHAKRYRMLHRSSHPPG